MLWHDMACLIDCVGMYDETKIMVGILDDNDDGLSTSYLKLLSCPCPSILPQDNYYSVIPSIYVQLGDSVVCYMMVSY